MTSLSTLNLVLDLRSQVEGEEVRVQVLQHRPWVNGGELRDR